MFAVEIEVEEGVLKVQKFVRSRELGCDQRFRESAVETDEENNTEGELTKETRKPQEKRKGRVNELDDDVFDAFLRSKDSCIIYQLTLNNLFHKVIQRSDLGFYSCSSAVWISVVSGHFE
jgi:hypothetical protein